MPARKPGDAQFVWRAALLGDREAFGRLVEAYQSPVRRLLFNLTGGDEELSKDLAQDTFLKAWQGIGSFRAAAKFSTWLYRIACNTFYDHARSVKQGAAEAGAADRLAAEVPDSDPGLDLARALTVLKPRERTAVLLYYMEDQPVGRIAAIMRAPTGTVKSHLHRGREKLAAYFKNESR